MNQVQRYFKTIDVLSNISDDFAKMYENMGDCVTDFMLEKTLENNKYAKSTKQFTIKSNLENGYLTIKLYKDNKTYSMRLNKLCLGSMIFLFRGDEKMMASIYVSDGNKEKQLTITDTVATNRKNGVSIKIDKSHSSASEDDLLEHKTSSSLFYSVKDLNEILSQTKVSLAGEM